MGEMNTILDGLVASRVVKPNELRGLSPAEITALEKRCGVRLPAAYREFLERAGRGGARARSFWERTCSLQPSMICTKWRSSSSRRTGWE
jgi:hypothetical protein